jgi:arylsulfatase A-like enzyme
MTSHPRPHVLLFLCDQMQYQRQGSIDPAAHTLNLDRLADEGVFFTQHHSANGQCVPSRVSIQTGLYPHEAQVMIIYRFHGHTAHITADQRTIGHVFREQGYTTAYFGKTHFGVPLDTLGYDIGDEGPPPAAQDEREGPRGRAADTNPNKMSQVDQRIMDAALRFLDSHDAAHPLFLTVSLHEPHPPFELVERWADRFAVEDMPVPESFLHDDLADKPHFQLEHASDAKHGQRDEAALREELRRYYTMISQVDDYFGQLRLVFERKGMWDDTVAVFTSDHGDMMGAHRMRLKGTLPYDEIFRIPLVLKLPTGSPTPTRTAVDDLSVNVSLAGTLMEAAGVPVPPSFTGGSILPSIWHDSRPDAEEIYFEHYGAYWGLHPFRAIKVRTSDDGQWKYVKYFGPDDGEAELYDLDADPFEVRNEAANPALAAWRTELVRRVDAWWQATGGRDFSYYESPEFKLSGAATLVDRSR